MEGAGGGGMGAIQQAMLQSQMAKESGGGGTANIIEPVKGVNTSILSVQTGNIDQVGNQCGGAMGLLSGNVLEGMIKLSELSSFGLPDIVTQARQCQSELSEQVEKIGNVLKLEGISPPEGHSEGASLSPPSTPALGVGNVEGQGIGH